MINSSRHNMRLSEIKNDDIMRQWADFVDSLKRYRFEGKGFGPYLGGNYNAHEVLAGRTTQKDLTYLELYSKRKGTPFNIPNTLPDIETVFVRGFTINNISLLGNPIELFIYDCKLTGLYLDYLKGRKKILLGDTKIRENDLIDLISSGTKVIYSIGKNFEISNTESKGLRLKYDTHNLSGLDVFDLQNELINLGVSDNSTYFEISE
ncbi:hypothetical protein RsoM2USA_276 [Ralstonia phage RsoM2USA]|nr:hypothetical protein RsoM2USA_276 [Ralstonia phage RsoM2USA]